MAEETQTRKPKILILATLSGGYAGADSVGQSAHRLRRQHLRLSGAQSGDVPGGFLPARVRARHRCHPGDVQRHR